MSSLNPFSEPMDHLVLKPERAGLADTQALGEVDVTAGFSPYSGEGARGSSYGGNHRLRRHERIILTHHHKRRGFKTVKSRRHAFLVIIVFDATEAESDNYRQRVTLPARQGAGDNL